MGATNRLKRLENKAYIGCFADVLSLIRAGRYYDELTQEEQNRYCMYRYGENVTEPPEQYLSTVFKGFPFDAHFRLEYKPKPLTASEIAQNIKEIDSYMQHRQEEFNSPEACEKRRKDYEELQEIGRKRKEAFYAGIPMDTYPLPWDSVSNFLSSCLAEGSRPDKPLGGFSVPTQIPTSDHHK